MTNSGTTTADQQRGLFGRYGVQPSDVIWTGRPARGLRFNLSDIYYYAFALLASGILIGLGIGTLHSDSPQESLLSPLFFAAGIFVLGGPFAFDAFVRSHTWYGLTADEALFLREGLGGRFDRVYILQVTLTLRLAGNGTGTIYFGDPPIGDESFDTQQYVSLFGPKPPDWWGWRSDVPAFEGIDDVQRVYDLCIKAQHPFT